ncbi:unnamed protein product [Oreochromis niloticus]|nr:unnamed protein product [Mustela putorius furo]
MKKSELKSLVVSGLVGKGVFPSDVDSGDAASVLDTADQPEVCAEEGAGTPTVVKPGGGKPPASLPRFEPFSVESSNSSVSARLKVRLARLELEAKERERKDELEFKLKCRQLEAETSIRLRQLELQANKLSPEPSAPPSVKDEDNLSNPSDNSPLAPAPPTFDVGKNIALVPPFRETEVEAYFNAFERIAVALHWPKEVWSLLLQCKLSGKAQEVCAALTIEDSLVYDNIKSAILRAYELVPEAYRQRFRTLRKSTAQTFLEFAREKGILFDRWCQASKVSEFNALRELVLLEEFKNCVPECTVLYLNEQKVATLQEAAVLAEEFALTHKSVFVGKSESPYHEQMKKDTKPHPQQPRGSSGSKSDRQCFYCHKVGHIVSECLALKHKQVPQQSKQAKGVGLVKSLNCPSHVTTSEPDKCFKPFIFDGFVSLTGFPGDQKPVRILRDTGGSQSFLLADVLPVSDESSCNASTIVQGIGMAYIPAPLHCVHVQSKLASGFFKVAVRNSFPVQGVEFIMGNDIAGDKVLPVPEVVDKPSRVPEEDKLLKSHPDVFSVSVLTRSQARKLEEVTLSETVLGSVLTGDREPAVSPSKPALDEQGLTTLSEVLPLPVSRECLSHAQEKDESLAKCFKEVEAEFACLTSVDLKGFLFAVLDHYGEVRGAVQNQERHRRAN